MATMDEIKKMHVDGADLSAAVVKVLTYEKGVIDAVEAKTDTLIGADTGKSARTIANEELAAQLIPANAQEALDTLKEIADYIQAHPKQFTDLNSLVQALQAILAGYGTDKDYATVAAHIAAIDAAKVDKETGKSLLADTEIERLGGMSDGANKTEVVQTIASGTKIGGVKVDGTETEFFAPTVTITAENTEGDKVATVSVGGVATDIYVVPAKFMTVAETESLVAAAIAEFEGAAIEE